MFGGNSNWRGPIWMPVNALVIRALLQYYGYYGKDFTVECPTGASHQTGWTGIIARIIELFAVFKPEYMEVGKKAYFKAEVESETASALVAR